ncbi:MAG TPA: FG-GAP-like repeat-containing protein [Planctomycetaceae bacterium]|nr:FG-GAP-like repeat-containing protein [Planctomycetaceae bacterium]
MPHEITIARARSGRLRIAGGLLLLMIGGFLCGCWRPEGELLEDGWRALRNGEPARAEELARQVLERASDSRGGLLLAASAAAAAGRFDDALNYCEQIPRDESRESIAADVLAGEILWQHKRSLRPAEARFREVLARQPEHVAANDSLAQILALQTRAGELVPFEIRMIRSGSVTPSRLYMLAVGDKLTLDEKLVRAADMEESGTLLAVAQRALFQHDVSRARDLLERAVQNAPALAEGQARLGRLLLDYGSEEEFLGWHRGLRTAPDAESHPGVWEVRGLWSARHGDPAGAARCLWEAVTREPNSVAANHQLGQALVALGRADEANAFLERARLLEEYRLLIDPARGKSSQDELTPGKCFQAARLCRRLGLVWEEYGWAVLASRITPPPAWAGEIIGRLKPQLATLPLSRAVPAANPALQLDLSDLPVPKFVAAVTTAPAVSSGDDGPVGVANRVGGTPATVRPTAAQADVRFVDRAAEAGIHFEYYNDGDPQVSGIGRPFEFTGGGVAVLDYDLDGLPDVYLAQGAELAASASQTRYDRLFRNLGDGRFDEISGQANVFEDAYSQGVAVGDVDGDGFPDVFVANIGPNRLYRNNGDGTFTDISHALHPDAGRWTTSAAIADLNGDGLPEIYTVNYLEGPDVYTRVCRDATGPRGSCTPRDFDGSQDQLYFNRGDGSFEEITASSGIQRLAGKGLGVVAADFAGTGRLSLFVANDGVANFFFENRTATPDEPPAFVERAVVSGLAYTETGNAQACMGVVAEDLTGDGALDLFVTNFRDEYNTLYVQQRGGLFADESRRSGLAAPSLQWLGFGAQAVDAELDGLPDLVVTNGHVDNWTRDGIDWQMPPQFFRNLGQGRFVELPPSGLGPYFEGRYLGRGMARLDWNRDGAEDVVITHLDAPAALLTNETAPRGRFLAVRLCGTRSSRDAIGTTVSVDTGAARFTRQLVAGDGYESSNERRLVFGLGPSSGPVAVDVRWPSGLMQRFEGVAVDQDLLIIEGRAEALPLIR